MKNWIYILLVLGFISCVKTDKKFEIIIENYSSTVELFNNYTFVEKVDEKNGKYYYSGTWSGSLTNGSIFTTVTNRLDGKLMKIKPERIYIIINGEVRLSDIVLKEMNKYDSENKSEEFERLYRAEKVNRMVSMFEIIYNSYKNNKKEE